MAFKQKGKCIEKANALRIQATLEAMKKRIAEAATKVGIDEDMHANKAFALSFPPLIYTSLLIRYHSASHLPKSSGGTKASQLPPHTRR